MRMRMVSAALVAAMAMPVSGCFEKTLESAGPLGVIFTLFQGHIPESGGRQKTAKEKIDTTLDVEIDAEVGGLSGDYAVTLSEVEGAEFGTFSGTGTIKKGRFVTIKDKGTEDLFSTVDAIVSRVLEQDVTILKAKAKVTANQEPGGVAANWKVAVKFQGTVDSNGAKVKGGKLLMAGHKDFD